MASIRPGNAFSGVFGPACFFIERTMQVPDGRDFNFFNFREFSSLNRLILGHFYKFRYFFNMRLISLMVQKKIMYFYITDRCLIDFWRFGIFL